jgi:hypothetical protein
MGIFAALLVTGVTYQSFAQKATRSRPANETSITELLQKRRAILSELVKVQTDAYGQGKVGIEAVVQAHQDLQLVTLELADDDDERIKLLEESVRLAGELQKIAEAKYNAGHASVADVLKSQADYLRAETDLLRERQMVTKD